MRVWFTVWFCADRNHINQLLTYVEYLSAFCIIVTYIATAVPWLWNVKNIVLCAYVLDSRIRKLSTGHVISFATTHTHGHVWNDGAHCCVYESYGINRYLSLLLIIQTCLFVRHFSPSFPILIYLSYYLSVRLSVNLSVYTTVSLYCNWFSYYVIYIFVKIFYKMLGSLLHVKKKHIQNVWFEKMTFLSIYISNNPNPW